MIKETVLTAAIILLNLTGWQVWQWYPQPLHQPISPDMVDSMMIWGEGLVEGRSGREATKEELADIVKWL